MSKQASPTRITSFKNLLFAVALFSTLPIMGCQESGDPRTIQIKGSITFNGKPIENGKISFTPDSQAGNSGPMGVCKIKDGEYSTDSLGGRGVVGGHHIVEIENFTAPPTNAAAIADPNGADEGGVASAENSGKSRNSQLPEAHLEDWDIPVDEPLIHRDFNIEK